MVNIVARKRPPPLVIGWNDKGISQGRKVLYRNFHQIEELVYLVEISKESRKVHFLLFPNFEKPEEYLHEMFTEKMASKLMSENNNSFEELIAKFYIKFGKLQI